MKSTPISPATEACSPCLFLWTLPHCTLSLPPLLWGRQTDPNFGYLEFDWHLWGCVSYPFHLPVTETPSKTGGNNEGNSVIENSGGVGSQAWRDLGVQTSSDLPSVPFPQRGFHSQTGLCTAWPQHPQTNVIPRASYPSQCSSTHPGLSLTGLAGIR